MVKQHALYLVGGIPTPLKNDGVKVSWDDELFPTEWNNKIHVPNHQPIDVCRHCICDILYVYDQICIQYMYVSV